MCDKRVRARTKLHELTKVLFDFQADPLPDPVPNNSTSIVLPQVVLEPACFVRCKQRLLNFYSERISYPIMKNCGDGKAPGADELTDLCVKLSNGKHHKRLQVKGFRVGRRSLCLCCAYQASSFIAPDCKASNLTLRVSSMLITTLPGWLGRSA